MLVTRFITGHGPETTLDVQLWSSLNAADVATGTIAGLDRQEAQRQPHRAAARVDDDGSRPRDGDGLSTGISVRRRGKNFVFFMMSDPATAPRTPRGRIWFGVLTAVLAAALVYPQPTEFGVKLAILSSLTVTCALVPFIDRSARRRERGEEALRVPADPRPALGRLAAAPAAPR